MQNSPMRIVIATGGFDPCHQGHISYLEAARALGDRLIVGLNSDAWLLRKKDLIFMHWDERAAVLRALRAVDDVIDFDDRDGTAIDAIRRVRHCNPDSKIIFANGGDRTAKNVPEMREPGVEFVFGVGGDSKLNSSSDILRRFERVLISKLSQDSNIFRSYT